MSNYSETILKCLSMLHMGSLNSRNNNMETDIGRVTLTMFSRRKMFKVNKSQWHETQNELVNAYLEHFCQESAGSLESFKDEFDVEFLKVIEEKIAIFNADDLTNLKVDIKNNLLLQYQEFSSEVQLKFLESNPDLFKVDDEVQLQLLIKNVQTLYIKIFEFNTETYYKKTLQPFNTGVNLDGLIASIEKQFEYSHAPNKKFIETFNFPELNGKIGLFIVNIKLY